MSYIHCARVSAIDCVSFISGTPQKQKNLMQGSLGANITVCCMDTTHMFVRVLVWEIPARQVSGHFSDGRKALGRRTRKL